MTTVGMRRCTIDAHLNFNIPLLNWEGVSAQFYSTIHKALTPDLEVNPLDFNEKMGISPGNSEAQYRVFGGPSTITLSAERLSLSFPNVGPSDYELLLRIMKSVDSGFRKEFRKIDYRSIRCSLNGHAAIVDGSSLADYFNPHRNPQVEAAIRDLNEVSYSPCIRFAANQANGEWVMVSGAEISAALQDGLFLSVDATLFKLASEDPFDTILDRVLQLVQLCSQALNLELQNEQ